MIAYAQRMMACVGAWGPQGEFCVDKALEKLRTSCRERE
uniref:Uncharacterized protein n=1 Tax=Bartonella rochalimae ATCC BAA-1498 TaxID=685782 RepID=E6YN95_9HYPH|nr:hypothetical protein BARRO_120107 [Bartonella rochalimae ATCC BAA-1498]